MPQGTAGALEVMEMWPIVDDQVTTASEGMMPLKTFVERASAVASGN